MIRHPGSPGRPRERTWLRRWLGAACIGTASLALAAACGLPGSDDSGSGRDSDSSDRDAPLVAPAPTGTPGMGQAEPLTNCTADVRDPGALESAMNSAGPGDRICITGDMRGERVKLERSGTKDRPIVILGGGQAITKGVTIEADHVVVDGIVAQQPEAPGISLKGTNITLKNSASLSPRKGDGDGIRFWGTDLKILHNTIRDTRGTDERHADCMQTFATDDDHPASQNVLIDSNRCEDIDNICLIAEGPNSEAGDGSGEGRSTRIVFSNNYCDNGAGQAVFLDDVTNAQVINNDIVGKVNKAFSFQNDSTGAKVSGNRIAPSIKYEVGIDESSEDGYDGPEPGGGP